MKRIRLQSLFVSLDACGCVLLTGRPSELTPTTGRRPTPLSGKPDLRVDTSDANIHVSTWEQNTIEAKVTTTRYKIGGDGIRIEEHQSGDMVEINVRYPHHGV